MIKMMYYLISFLFGIVASTLLLQCNVIAKTNMIFDMLEELDEYIMQLSHLNHDLAQSIEQIRDNISYELALMQTLL